VGRAMLGPAARAPLRGGRQGSAMKRLIPFMVWLVAGCGVPPQVADAGDGFDDAGALDAGPADDAGTADAGSADAGMVDAGAAADAGTPDAGPSIDAGVYVDQIKTYAAASACYRYQWLNRGQMPRGYAKGVALSFARGVCAPSRSDIAVVSMAKTTNTQRDALAWYSAEFSILSLDNSVAGLDTSRHASTLLSGLGMRESSGEHCTGRDMSATNTTADSAEAGAWQTSYDSRGSSPELPILFAQYRASNRGCFLSAYAEGVPCTAANWPNWGTGGGARFPLRRRGCPALPGGPVHGRDITFLPRLRRGVPCRDPFWGTHRHHSCATASGPAPYCPVRLETVLGCLRRL